MKFTFMDSNLHTKTVHVGTFSMKSIRIKTSFFFLFLLLLLFSAFYFFIRIYSLCFLIESCTSFGRNNKETIRHFRSMCNHNITIDRSPQHCFCGLFLFPFGFYVDCDRTCSIVERIHNKHIYRHSRRSSSNLYMYKWLLLCSSVCSFVRSLVRSYDKVNSRLDAV